MYSGNVFFRVNKEVTSHIQMDDFFFLKTLNLNKFFLLIIQILVISFEGLLYLNLYENMIGKTFQNRFMTRSLKVLDIIVT